MSLAGALAGSSGTPADFANLGSYPDFEVGTNTWHETGLAICQGDPGGNSSLAHCGTFGRKVLASVCMSQYAAPN